MNDNLDISSHSCSNKRSRVDSTLDAGSTNVLLQQTAEILEGLVLNTCKTIVGELLGCYDTTLYSDVFADLAGSAVSGLSVGICLERNVVIPIVVKGRNFGSLKVPFIFRSSSGRPLLILEIKTKRTALKDTDMDSLRCAAEQLGLQQALVFRGERALSFVQLVDKPCAMVVNFAAGLQTSMVMQRDGTVSS
jgi:hypothetical protein